MPVERPTFSESWYRVADLSPRLRSTVQVHRQHFRGQMWHVLQDPGSNQFFRLNEPAYHFVAMLDGERTVAEVWRTCNEQLEDSAPTQGEAIQLLGQLYTSNLLQAELPPDAEGLFRRYHKRRKREVQGYLTNLLFIRLPLIDPDRFLERWVGIVGWIFSWAGFAVWLAFIGAGMYFVVGKWGALYDQSNRVLDPENLPFLYLSFVIVKAFHEFSHAFACKKFGRKSGTGGEVHVMGIMFLVFMPLPYVDASSAWAFRSRRHRVVVGAAGMLVELAIASIATVIWAFTSEGTVHSLAYNAMFIASVSTLLFNGNPLLRFDGYYILSDLIEIPNLSERSKQYIYYLVKKYVWGVRQARNPAHSRGEKAWFVFYGIASTAYRVFICIRILLFLGDRLPRQFFVFAVVLGSTAAVGWIAVPLYKFVRYLFTNSELMRVRGRAMLTTFVVFASLVTGVGIIPAPDRVRIEGVVEPERLAIVHTEVEGRIVSYLDSDRMVAAGDVLFEAENLELDTEIERILSEREAARAKWRAAMHEENHSAARVQAEDIARLGGLLAEKRKTRSELTRRAPVDGKWISPEIDRYDGVWVKRGERMGMVASVDDIIIRAVADQDVPVADIDTYVKGVKDAAQFRVKGRPPLEVTSPELTGTVTEILPAGKKQLPSRALGYAAGGSIPVDVKDRKGTEATRRFHEIHIVPQAGARLQSGQRVIVRIELPAKPLASQWWRSLLQLMQGRFSF